MDTNELVEQLLRGPDPPEILSKLPEATAVAVIERLQQEGDRLVVIDPQRALGMAVLIIAIGQARADSRLSALGTMLRGKSLKILGRMEEAWEALEQAGNMFRAAGDESSLARNRPLLEETLTLRHELRNILVAFQNYKKGVELEREHDKAMMRDDIIKKILPVLNDLELALQNRPVNDAWSDGIELIARKLQNIIETENIERIKAEGLTFDPIHREAISNEPSEKIVSEPARLILSIAENQTLETEDCHRARKYLQDMLLGKSLESDEFRQAEAHVTTCPFCQMRLQLLAMEILRKPEGTCSIWRDQLHDYVEAQLAGHEEDPEFADLRRHLDACVDCAEAYALLYETMWAEQQGTIPEPPTMPTLDNSFLSSKPEADPLQHGLLDRLRNAYQTDDPSYYTLARVTASLHGDRQSAWDLTDEALRLAKDVEMDGFELFRRAIRNNDERAWEVIIVQYQPLVAKWVERWMSKHPDFPLVNEEGQDFIAQAFERFWISFTAAKFEKSQSLPAVLKYLQMCVHSAITDAWRKLSRIQLEQETREDKQEFSEPEPSPEDLLQKDEFWQLIRKKSKDPKEYIVVYASFSLNHSPREILSEYPDEFSDINEIYKYKANWLDRLDRDEDLKEFARR